MFRRAQAWFVSTIVLVVLPTQVAVALASRLPSSPGSSLMLLRFAAATLSLVLAAGAAWAHHSMAAVFNLNQRFERTGTLTKLDWTNPHIYLFVDARHDDGRVESWAFEGPSPVFFRNRKDFTKAAFQNSVGKTVTVDASRARDGSRTGLIRTVTLSDGKVVTLCPLNC